MPKLPPKPKRAETFLQYVCRRMFGRPDRVANGQSHWPCPQSGSGSFHTRPPKVGCKDRFSCLACRWYGDEFDAVKHALPRSTYPERLEIVGRLRAEYDRSEAYRARLNSDADAPPPDPLPRPARGWWQADDLPDLPAATDAAFRGLTEDEIIRLAEAVGIAKRVGVSDIRSLAYRCWHAVRDALRRDETGDD